MSLGPVESHGLSASRARPDLSDAGIVESERRRVTGFFLETQLSERRGHRQLLPVVCTWLPRSRLVVALCEVRAAATAGDDRAGRGARRASTGLTACCTPTVRGQCRRVFPPGGGLMHGFLGFAGVSRASRAEGERLWSQIRTAFER